MPRVDRPAAAGNPRGRRGTRGRARRRPMRRGPATHLQACVVSARVARGLGVWVRQAHAVAARQLKHQVHFQSPLDVQVQLGLWQRLDQVAQRRRVAEGRVQAVSRGRGGRRRSDARAGRGRAGGRRRRRAQQQRQQAARAPSDHRIGIQPRCATTCDAQAFKRAVNHVIKITGRER